MSNRTQAFLVLLALITAVAVESPADSDLKALASRFSRARVLVEIKFETAWEAHDMGLLRTYRLRPISDNKDVLIGRTTLVFNTTADAALRLQRDEKKPIAAMRWIKTYPAAAHYRIYFEYAGREVAPKLSFTVAMPRSAAGRRRINVKPFVWPKTDHRVTRDEAGNEFLTAAYADVEPGRLVLFDFYAFYEYDSEAIVQASLPLLGPTPLPESWPEEVQCYLRPGFHIESEAPEIVRVAKQLTEGRNRLDERAFAILSYVARHIKYDHDKREHYFGGRYVYRNAWEMWQGPVATLQRGLGCCPDTAELNVSLLRAAGIAARTAVHTGHLYVEVYVPGRGWLTDAPMYNVPIIRSPGADNCSYFSWEPELPVRCVEWGGRVRPFGQLRPGMVVDHRH